jgi:hypothetical protein
MKFIQNLSIRNKLLLISLIPLAALLYFLITTINSELRTRGNLESVYADVLEIEKITDAIYNIQEERGYSINFLNSGGNTDRTELFNARIQTDRSITALNRLVKEQQKNRNFLFLEELVQIRDGVNNLRTDDDSMAMAMSALSLRLADMVNIIYRNAKDPDIRNLLETQLFLVYSQNYLGQIRMRGHLAISAGKFAMNEFAEFANMKGKFESSLERYQKSLTQELLNEYRKKMTNPGIVHSYSLIDSIFRNPAAVNGMNNDNWRVNVNTFLNVLKDQQDYSTLYTKQLSQQKLSAINRSLLSSGIVFLLVIVLISLLLVYTIRSIVNPLMQIKNASDKKCLRPYCPRRRGTVCARAIER